MTFDIKQTERREYPIRIIPVGQKFGRLYVESLKERRENRQYYYNCKCDCGKNIVVRLGVLRNGHTKSCGCLRKETTINRCTTHGLSGTRPYNIWANMIVRCHKEKSINYERYGGRGINVCIKWRYSFENFWSDMGESYIRHIDEYGIKDTSIERKNNSKGYFKENCCWATVKEQANNRRKYKKIIK